MTEWVQTCRRRKAAIGVTAQQGLRSLVRTQPPHNPAGLSLGGGRDFRPRFAGRGAPALDGNGERRSGETTRAYAIVAKPLRNSGLKQERRGVSASAS